MSDIFSARKRSEIMSRIRSKNTKPELLIRRAIHRMGFRFRLHQTDLPGKPDIVLARYRTVIQVRGCFWHGHECATGHTPLSNKLYWGPKIGRNKARDRKNDASLRAMGWKVIEVWECACRGRDRLDTCVKQLEAQLIYAQHSTIRFDCVNKL
jgi:DNA mismatch endonuclease (patch repair protein)